jgi:hypothetical protein
MKTESFAKTKMAFRGYSFDAIWYQDWLQLLRHHRAGYCILQYDTRTEEKPLKTPMSPSSTRPMPVDVRRVRVRCALNV